MFRALLIALPFLFSAQAHALSCAQPSPQWWPSATGSVSPTPFIVLDDEAITSAWLTGPTRVELTIEKIGGHIVLRPKTPLKIGATYTLEGTGPYRFKTGVWGVADNKRAPVKWTVAADKSAAPQWTGEITVGKSSARTGHWGPTSRQELNLSWKSDAKAIAEVVMTRGKQTQTLLLPVHPDKPLSFGQGLCDGEINLIGEGDWTAKITLIGPSGQRSKTKTVTFPSPVPTPR